MSLEIKKTDNIKTAKDALKNASKAALESCGLAGENYAKQACPVDTGALRNSITHNADENECVIGTDQEYAAYVELGTGIYYDGGRTTPWVYCDSKGNFHMTHGQRAQPYLKPAVADHTDNYKRIIEDSFKNG